MLKCASIFMGLFLKISECKLFEYTFQNFQIDSIIKLPNVALHVIILIYHGVFFSSAYSFYAVSSVFF